MRCRPSWFLLSLVLGCGCAATAPGAHVSTASPSHDTPNGSSEVSMGQTARDICGFSDPVTLGPKAADGFIDVPANHPDIYYMGRIDCKNPLAPSFAYPGVSIRVRFQGNGVDMMLEDFGDGTPTGTNYYGVSIDENAPKLVEVSKGQRVYELARNLSDSAHSVEIFKRVESNHGGGKANFLGVRIPAGEKLLPPSPRARRLEFIGDSITCGYGNELSTNDPTSDHYTTKNSNAQRAYGAMVAQTLGAEYVAVAASGRGVSRNYGGEPGTLVPELHALALPDETTPWDYSRYQPDVTVLNLGTNDYSTPGIDRQAFRARYRQFLVDLRRHYPKSILIASVGPMLSDAYPPGEQVWTKIREDVTGVVADLEHAGEKQLYYLEFAPQTPPFGEDWHPTVATHQRMASELVTKIKSLTGW